MQKIKNLCKVAILCIGIIYKDANGVIKYSGHTHDRRNAVTSLPDKYTYYRVNFS